MPRTFHIGDTIYHERREQRRGIKMSEQKSIITTTAREDAEREESTRIPDTITREQYEKWMDGLYSELIAGGCLAADPESKAWNDATFRAGRVVKNYKQGRGMFQWEDLP